MKFLKNIANKKVAEKQTINISDEDRDLLAVLCGTCVPMVQKGVFMLKTYSYYFPADEDNLDVIIKLFAKYGLVMEQRTHHHSNGFIERFVRVEHKNRAHGESVAGLMRVIHKRKQEIARDFCLKHEKSIWWKLQERINDMKQIEK